MNEIYDHLPLIRQFNELCATRKILRDWEPGDRVIFQGHEYIVAVVQWNGLALVDELAQIPLDPSQWVFLPDWESNPDCLLLPRIDHLLDMIQSCTSLYPIMTPGIKETKAVWQISHPNSSPIVSSSLEDGLLQLAILLLIDESINK